MLSPTELTGAELAGAVLGTLFITVGIGGIGAARLRSETHDRSLIWFGVFTLLYGARLVARSDAFHAVVGLTPTTWQFIEHSITYFILVPAALLTMSVVGAGWHVALRHIWRLDLVCGIAAIIWDVATGRPGAALPLNPALVAINVAAGVASLASHARRHAWTRDGWLVAAGASVFMTVAMYETFRGRSFAGGKVDAEPIAMLVFIASLGYAVVHRAFQNERRVAAVGRELETARRIQESILPQRPPDVPGLSVATHYDSMAEVAGDFFDFVVARSGRLGVLVADVSGHGVPAAIVASMVKMALAVQGNDVDDPAAVLTRMNRALCGRFELAYVTAVFALVDARAGTVTYASAGHPSPLVVRGDGRVESLDERGLVLGLMSEAIYTAATVRDVAAQDRLVFYTDGLTEAARADGEFFGDRELHRFLTTNRTPTTGHFTAELVDTARRWTGADFADDVTIVVVECT